MVHRIPTSLVSFLHGHGYHLYQEQCYDVHACCQSNLSLTGVPSLWWWHVGENRWHCIWLKYLLQRSKPFQNAISKVFGWKMLGALLLLSGRFKGSVTLQNPVQDFEINF